MNEIRPVGQGVGKLETLAQIERKLVWLASWMIHHANHIRPNPEGLKVGGHQQVASRMGGAKRNPSMARGKLMGCAALHPSYGLLRLAA